jgi:hypothetical protein
MIRHHVESNTTFCDAHYVVLNEQRRCPRCTTEPRPTVYVDGHAVDRWVERIGAAPRHEIVAAVQRIVTEGQHLAELERRVEGFTYHSHPDWPRAVVVVKKSMNAAITVLVTAEAA